MPPNKMSPRSYKKFADLVVSIHFLWTLFLLAGAIVMFIHPAYALIQIIVMTFTLFLAVPFNNTCPLTLLEEKLRQKFDPSYRNDGSYIAAYFNKIFNKHVPTSHVNSALAGLYVLTYALATAILILRGYGFLAG